jgi:putative phosphoribosyl transferase
VTLHLEGCNTEIVPCMLGTQKLALMWPVIRRAVESCRHAILAQILRPVQDCLVITVSSDLASPHLTRAELIMIQLPYQNRVEAAHVLLESLRPYRERSDVLVLGLPRGGIPVAYEVATALEVPLDLLLVRKLGVPGHEELALGAIATGGVRFLNQDVIRRLDISAQTIESVTEKAYRELQRREGAYRGGQSLPELTHRCVMLIDDGLATGATMRAAVTTVRQSEAPQIIVAVPVAPAATITRLCQETNHIVCPATPAPFHSISRWYVDFPQVPDAEVRACLDATWQRQSG